MAISKDLLLDFAGALATATDAPDDYGMPELINYERNKADLILLIFQEVVSLQDIAAFWLSEE